jgi:AcrR family transcriptional regulator
MEEITTTARRLLVGQGADAASLRAIAREMGMTAPGLYRYYDSREELIRHVCADIFRELAAAVRQAIAAAAAPPPVRALPAGRPAAPDEPRLMLARKLVAACHEFRRWSLSHRGEFGLLFGVPVPGLDDDGGHDIAQQCALEFAATFYTLFLELWEVSPFPVLADAAIDPQLRPQLASLRDKLGAQVPEGAVLVLLRCWVLLYGAVAMEAFGHLDFALGDPVPMFDLTLSDLAAMVGLQYPVERPPH